MIYLVWAFLHLSFGIFQHMFFGVCLKVVVHWIFRILELPSLHWKIEEGLGMQAFLREHRMI